MYRVAMCTAAVAIASAGLLAQGRVLQQGRAIVEFRSPQVNAVAAYAYSQRHHAGEWVLVEFAVQTKERIAFHRNEISLITPDERTVPVATQEQFLEDHAEINQLLQNATIWRRPLGVYFRTPLQQTIRFFSYPGRIVHDTATSNQDDVATGDLLFKLPGGGWPAGTYRLVFDHETAKAELPITLD